jgi:hypothetical protein
VFVHPGVRVTHRPFNWSLLLPSKKHRWSDAPVVLTASKDYETGDRVVGEATPTSPVDFVIRPFYEVTDGYAGMGTLLFRFRNDAGTLVTCTYKGAAREPNPTAFVERLRGKVYRFVSCDDGSGVGRRGKSQYFSLEVVEGENNELLPLVSVTVGVGDEGCNEPLPAPMGGVEAAALRDNFNWDTTAALPEIDPDGHPALWHGLIYIDRKEQVAALHRLRIFWSAMPISERYMETLRGRCGLVQHATDGRGVFVYALFPAKFYNVMRTFAAQAAARNIVAPFRMIIPAPPTEPEYANTDGSVKYSALASSRYLKWLQEHPSQMGGFWDDAGDFFTEDIPNAAEDAWEWTDDNVVEPGVEYSEDAAGYLFGSFDDAIDWAFNAADDYWEDIQEGLQDFVLEYSESIDVRLIVEIENRDPMFPPGSLFTRAWGPNDAAGARPRVVPAGARLRIRQWGWGFLPVMGESKIRENGRASLEAVKGADGREGDLCIELDTDYAMMTTDFIPNEVCDFAVNRYGNFKDDINDTLTISQQDLHSLTQVKDSHDYVRTVIGHDPHKMQILIGPLANTMTKLITGKRRAQCLCLDFPGVGAAAITVAVSGTLGAAGSVGGPVGAGIGFAAGVALASLYEKDLWWPNTASRQNSRGVMTHEYGHFTMCSMMFDEDGPSGLTGLIARIVEGEKSRTEEVALMTEAWADVFLMQVAGGANYVNHIGSTSTPPVGEDVPTGTCIMSPCMDRNYAGIGDYSSASPFHDEMARYQSLIHDFFDRSDSNNRLQNAPWNGDVWVRNATTGTLEFSPVGYIANDDEPISLPGSAWRQWITRWLERGRVPNLGNVIGGLLDTARDNGASWCDICETVAPHFPLAKGVLQADWDLSRMKDASGTRSVDVRFNRWRGCASDSAIRALTGTPPESELNLDASCTPCPPLHHLDVATGNCSQCPTNQVPRGDHCDACPTGTVAMDNNSCSDCGANRISVGNQCVECPEGTVANKASNLCELCSADAFWAWQGEPLQCNPIVLTIDPDAFPQDNCPTQFWVRMIGLDDAVSRGANQIYFSGSPFLSDPLSQSQCQNRSIALELWEQDHSGKWTLSASDSVSSTWVEDTDCQGGFGCFSRCEHRATIALDPSTITPGHSIRLKVEATPASGGRIELNAYNHDICSAN